MNQAVIEGGRAEFALNAVKKVVKSNNEQTRKEYKSYARKFPSLAPTNGLAAAAAFAFKKGGAWGLIYGNISDWLRYKCSFAEPTTLIEYVCSLDSDEYRVATNEALSFFVWLSRFASGLIEGEPDD